MTAKKTQTPQERIAAMKAAVAEKEAREKAEKDRQDRKMRLENSVSEQVLGQFKALDNLPVSPNGFVKVERKWMESGNPLVSVFRRGYEDRDGELETVMEALFEVEITTDHDGQVATLMHDDHPVTESIALDLATAVVESRFKV